MTEQTRRLTALKELRMPGAEVISASGEKKGRYQPQGHPMIEALPDFGRILLKIESGERGVSYTEIWLPENWNGILVGTGNGGLAGSIAYGTLADYARLGYAVANTDMGTSAGEAAGIGNPDMWKDFGWRATHLMTLAAKEAVRLYYGRAADYCYFTGGSTGGQQSLAEAQRFPEDYDGIIATVPANNRTMLHTYFLWNHVHLRKPDGRVMFTAEEIVRITDLVTAFYQQQGDGCPGDAFVTFPKSSESLIEEVLAYLKREHPAFSEEQLEALRAVYDGPKNPRTGERIYNGLPMGSEIYHCAIADSQAPRSPNIYPFLWVFGADFSAHDFDFDRDMDRLNQLLAADLNANHPDLSAFADRGGKLLICSGSADPCVPFPDAMGYYERVLAKMGGYEKVGDFCRYFLMPGRDHGNTGRGTNVLESMQGGRDLDALRAWREQGVPPDALRAVRRKDGDPQGEEEYVRVMHPYGSPDFPQSEHPPVCEERYLG